ncbi:uncharacterized protein LOC127697059 [Apodemus sylvaticus]|uniref:uncharacterized protein LOC127697059 n=1 Tax=Apodemus sylvaticus TaxID=10129 RepID=UPI00224251CE|nr:uncharacterized protein LOC127697059 [Apodemus sylvaticus]
MVSQREQAAAAGRAPRLRERDDGAATGTRTAAGEDAAHLLPRRPPPEGRAPQPTCKPRVGPGPGGGSSVVRSGGGSRLRCGSGADAEHRGARAHLPPPLSPAQPPRARSRAARARAEDGARPETHKPGSRGAGGGGRRHPRVIGRSNREPSAWPRVQSSNRAEEELPPKTAKIGHRNTHRARPAYFSKTLAALTTSSHLGGNAIVLPEGRSGPGSWILRSVRDPGFAPCPSWSWIYLQFRIAWLRCVVWMDRRAPQVPTGQPRLPAKAATSGTGPNRDIRETSGLIHQGNSNISIYTRAQPYLHSSQLLLVAPPSNLVCPSSRQHPASRPACKQNLM